MILSDNKFLRSHAFGGVDFDEIIESGFLSNCLNAWIIVDFGGRERDGAGGVGAGGVGWMGI